MPSDSDFNQPADDLQFETAEPIGTSEAAPTRSCVACHRPITSTYYAIRDKIVCPGCCAQIDAPPVGIPAGRVLKAGFMGLGAGLVGAVIWFAIRRLAHMEIGLVAVFVGVMVGKAIRKGSGNRGGVGYQVMAVVVTYCCIAANYMPDAMEALNDGQNYSTPADQLLVAAQAFKLSMQEPFLAGTQNLLGLLIIGIALWQAWKFNTPRTLAISGPYQVGSTTGGVVL